MRKLKNRDTTPPDQFRYTHRDGYVSGPFMNFEPWMADIRRHCKANGYPIVTEAEAEDQLCQQIPPEDCEHDSGVRSERSWNTRLGWTDIVDGARAYAKMAVGITQPVELTEANRRARICTGCFLRVTPQGCGACHQMAQIIGDFATKRKTQYDDQIQRKACAVCKCPVSSIVHFPMSVLQEADAKHPEHQENYPSFCWRKEGGENFKV